MKISVVIPTLNASAEIESLLISITKQTLKPNEIIVVDSESDDETVTLANPHPLVRVISIQRDDFNHGGTRDMAFRASIGRCCVIYRRML